MGIPPQRQAVSLYVGLTRKDMGGEGWEVMSQARVTRLGKVSVRDVGVRGQPRKFPRLAQSSVRPWQAGA